MSGFLDIAGFRIRDIAGVKICDIADFKIRDIAGDTIRDIIVVRILNTRPRPAFGRLGLGGSSGGYTLGVASQ